MASREMLAEATSIHEGPVPAYLLDQIARQIAANDGSGEKVADFLLGRMNKNNINVRLKALQIIAYCLKTNNQGFINVVREDEEDIQHLANYQAPADPAFGDEKNKRVRQFAQDILGLLNTNTQPNPLTQSPQPAYNSAPQGNYGQQAAPAWGNNTMGQYNNNAPPMYGGNNQYQNSSQNPPYAQGQYGQRPTPYSDSAPSSSPFRETYPSSGQQSWGNPPPQQRSSYSNSSSNTWSASNNAPPAPVPQYGQQNSWRSSQSNSFSDPPSYEPKPAASVSGNAAGVWGKGGFERRESNPADPSNIRWSSSRDNRPTVLVGGKGSLFNSTRPVPSVGTPMMAGSGISGISISGMNGPPQPYPSSGPRLPTSSMPVQEKPTTAFSQKLDVIKKKGMGVIDMWDRRNMDKEMVSSLAEHDDYVQTDIRAMDRGAAYNPQGIATGSSDKSGDYERTLIDDLCPPGGLARAPPSENLKRFVDLAKTLDIHTIGELLLDKLEDSSWLVRLKGLCVWEALLEAPGCSHYGDWLEENIELVQHLTADRKSHVSIKAKQVLALLGIEVSENIPKQSPVRPSPVRTEVDILGLDMGNMSVDQTPPPPAQPVVPPTAPTQNLLSFSPPMNPMPTPTGVPPLMNATLPPDATRSLSDFGKDLFTLANSPRQTAMPAQPEKSAFSFM